MKTEKKQKIEELAIKSNKACERLQMLGMLNTANTPKDREKQAVEYAVARAEAHEARTALEAAISS